MALLFRMAVDQSQGSTRCCWLRRALGFDSPDLEPVRLVFLVLTPVVDSEAQVRILGSIARQIRTPEVREAALAARTPTAVLAAFRIANALQKTAHRKQRFRHKSVKNDAAFRGLANEKFPLGLVGIIHSSASGATSRPGGREPPGEPPGRLAQQELRPPKWINHSPSRYNVDCGERPSLESQQSGEIRMLVCA